LAADYDAERISHAIAYTQVQIQDGKLNNPAGFVVEATKNGYRDNRTEERQRKEEAAKLETDKETKRKEWENIKTRWNAWKTERVRAYIAALDAETLKREKAAFQESVKGSVMAKTIFASQENEARHFRIYITGKMEGLGLSEWVQAVGADISPFAEFAGLEQGL
jgi:hypothetical protein